MLARLLAHLGVAFGDRVLDEETPDNLLGYWEQADVMAIQEGLLDRLDRRWYGPRGTLTLPEDWRGRPGAPPLLAWLRAVMEEELAAAQGALWGFKDPRTLRFLPLWREIFAGLGVQPTWILAVRHPAEVVGSLMARNAPQGMSPARAQLLWLDHNLAAVRELGAQIALVPAYHQWFVDPLGMAARLTRLLDLPPPDPRALAGFVRPDLRHHAALEETDLLPLVRETWRALTAAAPEPPPLAPLRALCAEYDRARAVTAAWTESLDAASLDGARLAGARAARDRLATEAECAAAEAEALAAERDRLVAERDRLAAERDRLAAERDRLAAERDRLATALAAHRDATAALARAVASMLGSTSWRLTAGPRQLLSRLRGQPLAEPFSLPDDPRAVAARLLALTASASWEVTGPLRALARRLRRG